MAQFDKTKPAGSTKLRDSDDQIRSNSDALEDAIGRNHQFPTGYGTVAGEHTVVDLQNQAADPSVPTGKLKVYAKTIDGEIVLVYMDTSGVVRVIGGTGGGGGGGAFPSGTRMLFYQDVAPTGWTIQTALNDKLVFVTKGSVAGGQEGGIAHTTGSWTISGFGNIGNHTLTVSEMPAHSHGLSGLNVATSISGSGVEGGVGGAWVAPSSEGGGASHNHPMGSHDGSWRPAAYNCIICVCD